ncbi:MAG: NAD-binding protein [Nitrososphaeria archaeon]|nr:NAD-binding protein [Nitrososphaeria archaeon]NIN53460.1 NAD-binding protein [Nitrososphaeria archaeon]NIQ33980.1 NAD-binding protein [Nitrososphaeria archaeon]
MKKIGFIGVGKMGNPMSMNLLKAGFELTIYDVNRDAMQNLISRGVNASKSPREVAEVSDVVLTCLPSPEALEEVVLGEDGVFEGIEEENIFIDLGSTDPGTIRKIGECLKQKGVEMLDAPVNGGVEGAEAGTLTIMAGGKKETFEKCSKIFQSIGEKIFYIGELGTGSVVKIVNNLIGMCSVAAVVEGLALGVKAGVDSKTLYEVVKTGSAGQGKTLEWICQRIAKGDYEAGFKISLVRKDLGLAHKLGKEMGVPLFMTNTADQIFSLAQAKDLEEKDTVAIALLYENLLKIKWGEETLSQIFNNQ